MQPTWSVLAALLRAWCECARLALPKVLNGPIWARNIGDLQRLAAEIDPSAVHGVRGIDLAAPYAGDTIARELTARGRIAQPSSTMAGLGLFWRCRGTRSRGPIAIIAVNIRTAYATLILSIPPD